jgi:hypothetical protein
MGSGSFSSLGSVSDFIPSPTRERITTAALTAPSKEQIQELPILPLIGAAVVATTSTPLAFSKHLSSYLRVVDLQTDQFMLLHSVASEGSNIGNGNSAIDSQARGSFSLIVFVSVLVCGIWMLIGRNGGDLCGSSVDPIYMGKDTD